MRQRGVGAPPCAVKNLDLSSSGDGRKIRTDSNRPLFSSPSVQFGTHETPVSAVTARALHY
jgi:hypothetical protein